MARTAAQWVKLNTSGNDVDGGRVQDPTATATNGGKWYAYPQCCEQPERRADRVLPFSSAQFPPLPPMHFAARPTRVRHDPRLRSSIKAGQGHYWKFYPVASCTSSSPNRWGDYSATTATRLTTNPVDAAELSKPQGSPFAATGCGSVCGTRGGRRSLLRQLLQPFSRCRLGVTVRRSVTWRTAAESRSSASTCRARRVRVNRALIRATHSGGPRARSTASFDRAALRSSPTAFRSSTERRAELVHASRLLETHG